MGCSKEMNFVGLAGLIVCGVAFLFTLVALGIPEWINQDLGNTELSFGLWRQCIKTGDTTICRPIQFDALTDRQERGVKATRAFLIMAVILYPVAIISASLVLFLKTEKHILFHIAGGIVFVAGFFLMLGFAIFVGEVKQDGQDVVAGVGLTIASWLMLWICGVVFIWSKSLNEGHPCIN